MKLVQIASPFRAPSKKQLDQHIAYAKACLRDSIIQHKEAPFAPHLLYTQPGILRDEIPSERELGMQIGNHWMTCADFLVVYEDLGISEGMRQEIERAERILVPVIFRKLPGFRSN